MHVLVVPLIERKDRPHLGSVLAPDVPDGIEWGQASGLWAPLGKQAIWTRAEGADLDACVDRGSQYVGCVPSPTETAKAFVALRGEKAPEPGAKWSACEDVVCAYREIIAPHELQFRGGLALTVFCSDTWSGSGGWDARTMDAGDGGAGDTWQKTSGSDGTVGASNTMVVAVQGSFIDATASAVDVQRTTQLKSTSTALALFSDVYARATTAATLFTGYLVEDYNAGANVMYRHNGAGTYVQLGSAGSTPAVGHTFGTDASGTTITGLYDGASDIGPATDATYATGVMAFVVRGTIGRVKWEVASVASSRIGARTMQIPNFGRVGVRNG